MFESVNGCTDRCTDRRRLESHPISSPGAFGSGELKIWQHVFVPLVTQWPIPLLVNQNGPRDVRGVIFSNDSMKYTG